ncbi:MAG: VanZ family protein [Treponema sp.]|nr:VanZ family protein [Treponema sp.]
MPLKIGSRLLAPFFMAAIWFFSSHSTLPDIKGIIGWDKFQHLFAYMVLALSVGLWFSFEQWRTRRLLCLLVCVGIVSIYGGIDEIHQYFVPGRDCNVWDWIADTIGAFLGTLVMIPAASLLKSKMCKVERNGRED